MGSIFDTNDLDKEEEESQKLDFIDLAPKNCLLKLTKLITLPFRMQFQILNDGRIGGKSYDTYRHFMILNPKDLSIQMEILFDTQLIRWKQMKNGLLVTYCEKIGNNDVNIIKLITESKYEIIHKINLPYFGFSTYAFALSESCEGDLIIGYPNTNELYYYLLFYEVNYNKCELKRKQTIKFKCDTYVSIYPLKGQTMLRTEKTLIFINSKTSQILYNKNFEFSITIIMNYNKDLLLLGCYTQIYLFNWKNHEFIKTINCRDLDGYEYFFQPHLSFNEYIIAERGKSGHGYGQESLKIFKIIHKSNNKVINENEIKVFEEIQDLGLKNKNDNFSFIINNNTIYIKFEDKKILIYEISQKL